MFLALPPMVTVLSAVYSVVMLDGIFVNIHFKRYNLTLSSIFIKTLLLYGRALKWGVFLNYIGKLYRDLGPYEIIGDIW